MITVTKTYEIEQIKDILIEEEKSWWGALSGIPRERRDFWIESAVLRIKSLQNEEEIEKFIRDSRRMSLRDWVESL